MAIKLQKKPKLAIAQQSSLLNTFAGQYISFRTEDLFFITEDEEYQHDCLL
jgi:hypothetical protein